MPAGRVRVGAGLVVALMMTAAAGALPVGATSVGPSAAADTRSDAPAPCPSLLAESAMHAGMVGTGWTVTTGDTPRAFQVKVLGTLQDGIGPGRDLIVIKVSDLPGAHVISQGGGIWAGMSGSPVYLGGKLAGAVSYGFSNGPSRIGGMTPAGQMNRIATYSAPTSTATADRQSVRLSAALRSTVAREAGVTTTSVQSLHRLALPIVVTATAGKLRNRLTSALRREFGSIRMMSGAGPAAASTASTTLAAPPVAGGNLAGVIASGDVTIAAVGTATSVCGDTVLGFGHPFTGSGKVAFEAARARSLTIVDDPAGTPFKLANIGRAFGLLDQDRQSGIRATVGKAPRDIALSARIRATDTDYIRTGHTSVTTSSWVPIVAANHLLTDIVATADNEGPGTAGLTWTIKGTRPNGQHWTVVRTDRVASTDDVALDSGQLLFDQLSQIDDTAIENVRFDSVTMQATVSPVVKQYLIQSALVSRNGGPWKQRSSITAHPGDQLRFKVTLKIWKGATTTTIVGVTVPASAFGSGYVTIGDQGFDGGSDCSFDPSRCPTTFHGLLQSIRDAPRADDLQLSLDLTAFDPSGARVDRVKHLDKVVTGSIEFPIDVH